MTDTREDDPRSLEPVHTDEMQIEPQQVSVAPYEPSGGYFPAGYELKPNAAEPEVFDSE